jgi:O-methyltransferase
MGQLEEAAQLIYALVLGRLARLSSTRAGAVVVYHRVGGTTGDHDVEILPAVGSNVFARQLHHLRRHYRVVPAAEILEATRSRRRGQRFPVSITFDDDLASHVRDALPALRRAMLPATFFLSGSSLEGPQSFWWEDLQRAIDGRLIPPDGIPHVPETDVRAALGRSPRAILDVALSIRELDPGQKREAAAALRAAVGEPAANVQLRAQDVRSLAEADSAVGFHTLEHDVLPALSDSALEHALRNGREQLAAAAGGRLDLIAYPHGKADGRVAEAARAAGFALGFTTARGPVTPDTDPHLIPRTVPDMSVGAFALRLARAFRKGRALGSAPDLESGPVRDGDDILQANQRLQRELHHLRARIHALESSRWWRLHPRFALQRLRERSDPAAAEAQTADGTHELPIDFDDTDAELCRRVAPYTMTTPPRIYALARAVEYVAARPVEGAFVECGVWRGGSMMAIALTLLRLGVTDRELYLFDTFEGMTKPGEEDVKHSGERATDLLAESSRDSHDWAVASLDQVREAVLSVGYPEERIHFVQGPVEETLPEHAPAQIALLRLDTDWYSSTKHGLMHLYPHLTRGGVLIVDDYAYWQGARQAVDEYIQENGLPLLLNRIDYTARIAVRP